MSEALAGLEQLARDRTAREGLTVALAATQERAEQARHRVAEARARLADEQVDVDALESMSMTRILAGLRGSRDADLDRERAEAVAAEYQVAEAEARAAAEDREVASLEARIAEHGDLDARRTELLAHREHEVRIDPASAAAGEQLTELATRVGELRARTTQLAEADAAGRQAHRALQEAAQHLGSAGSWATYDTFFGGGLIGDMVKHDKLDRAGSLMQRADLALRSLATELADVGIGAVEGVGITQLTKAFDVWFDNIFSDWAVRDRISKANERVQWLLGEVSTIGIELDRRRQATADELAAAEAERERILTADV